MTESGRYQPVFRNPGDWVALAALAPFLLSVLALPWLSVTIRVRAFGTTLVDQKVISLKLFDVPWYWTALLFALLGVFIACFFMVRTRGAVTTGVGACFLLFNVLFFVGAWYKINAIIGDISGTVGGLPLVGRYLGALVSEISKRVLVVRLESGYYVFIAAGLLLAAGGVLRLVKGAHKD